MKVNQKSGLSLSDGLLLMFVYLKLTGQINWHWGWVVSPFIASIIVIVCLKMFYEKD